MLDPNRTPEDYADAFVHGLLSDEEAVMFEDHCDQDEAWRRALSDAQRRKEALASIPPVEGSEKLVQATMANIESNIERRNKVWKSYSRSVLALAATAAAAILAFNIYFYQLKPSPYDIRVLGQRDLLSGTQAALRVAVFEQGSGKELSGVPVRLTLVNRQSNESVDLGKFTSGEDVAARLQLPDWKDGNYELRVIATPDGRDEILTQSLSLRREWKLMLSSDKPIYQPGQTIHVRAIALRKPDLKPVAGEQVEFKIVDPKGNVIFKHRATGSQYGIASADCPLATEILQGKYNIECRIGETLSSETVTVEKYVLPKFKIEITLDKPFYQPGEEVKGTIQADYFFGQPVAKGEVQIDVRTTDVESFSIASITETTDEKGAAKFNFTLPQKLIGREQEAGNAKFALAAAVTDTAGQKYARGIERIVTAHPISLEVIPEAGALVKGVVNKVYLFASYADGRPAEVKIDVNDMKAQTNKLGVATIEVAPKGDSLGMTLSAKDEEGREGRRHVILPIGRVADDFVVRTDKATYTGGDELTLTALGGGVEPVFVDFIKDGQTILTTSVEMKDGQGHQMLDVPPEMFGTIKVVAYRFGKAGLAVRKTRMIFVRQARELQIAATLQQKEYRPGETAKLQLKLIDGEGKPTPGEISLAAVDEAVYSVLGQRPGMEEVFFLLEKELLEPVYAIYNFDPFEDRSAPISDSDVIQLEQAIFSSTARVNTGYDAVPAEFVSPEGSNNVKPWGGEFGGAEPAMAIAPDMPPPAGEETRIHVEGDASPFTLAAASYPTNRDKLLERRDQGLIGSVIAWASLIATLIVVGIATFAVYKPKAFLLSAVIFVPIACLVALLLPAVQSAREAARAVGMAPEMDMAFGGAMTAEVGEAATTTAPADEFLAFPPAATEGGAAPPRLREWFPETLFWNPQIITNDQGEASIEIPLADSITTWRLTTSAVSADGHLGGGQLPIRVFQPFFVDLDLPVALTRNDQVSVPVVVYNYRDEPQRVKLQLEAADWFTRVDDAGMDVEGNPPLELELAAGEIRSLHIHLKVKRVGFQQLQVTATGAMGIADAIKRQIEVIPNGRREEQIVSGSLDQPATVSLNLPADAIEGSPRAIVKLYPTSFSQLVEGLDAIFQMPYGCFEQTSSTTYPNVLALDYLRRTKLNAPEVEAKARQYIHIGYQRLVSFEVRGGGFDWFGNPPANQTLTAYGLMEFEDMARVYDVDQGMVDRTRDWLLSKREADGRWKADLNMLHDGLAGSVLTGEDKDLANTAYIAWAVFGMGKAKEEAKITLEYLLTHEAASIKSPYTLAIIANCIAGIDPKHRALAEYLSRLDALKQQSENGKEVWWTQVEGERTMFYGDGPSGDIETTAMAALALMKSGQHTSSVRGALTWLIGQKDGRGTWHSTQATVLALKALVEGTGSGLGEERPRGIEIALGTKFGRTIEIPVDQADVMQQIDLSEHLAAGEQQLTITDLTKTGTGYQVAFWYYVDEVAAPPVDAQPDPLSINIAYDREQLNVDDYVSAKAIVINNMEAVAPMVILDLPIPGGFAIEPGDLDELVGTPAKPGKIAKYQITARKAIIYLRALKAGEQLELPYRLKATMPVKVAVPPGAAYEYYNPQRRGESKPALFEASLGA